MLFFSLPPSLPTPDYDCIMYRFKGIIPWKSNSKNDFGAFNTSSFNVVHLNAKFYAKEVHHTGYIVRRNGVPSKKSNLYLYDSDSVFFNQLSAVCPIKVYYRFYQFTT